MKVYPYNKRSKEGRLLHRSLSQQFNPGVTRRANETVPTFEQKRTKVDLSCRVSEMHLLMPDNSRGIERPSMQVRGEVEQAWGTFGGNVEMLDFTHGGASDSDQALPIDYTQPIEDETMIHMIEAGLYRDERFEELLSKLMQDEVFTTSGELTYDRLDIPHPKDPREKVPTLLVEPVHALYDEYEEPTFSTLNDLARRSSQLAIVLEEQGVSRNSVLNDEFDYESDKEVYLGSIGRDVVQQEMNKQESMYEELESEQLDLDSSIDVTEQIVDPITFDGASEDDHIRDLKDSVHATKEVDVEEMERARRMKEEAESEGFTASPYDAILDEIGDLYDEPLDYAPSDDTVANDSSTNESSNESSNESTKRKGRVRPNAERARKAREANEQALRDAEQDGPDL